MTLRSLLVRSARAEARGRAAAAAWRIALLGLIGVAVALFCERAGIDVPFLVLPEIREGAGLADRVIGYVAISTAGLIQGAVLGGIVVGVALLARAVLSVVLRKTPTRVAAKLDAILKTERFSAALEAEGPFAPLVEREALRNPPEPKVMITRRSSRMQRALAILAMALILVVAVLPGVAPGQDGDAPVLGAPDPGQKENKLKLTLVGPTGELSPGEPILLSVKGETSSPPSADLELPTTFVLDDQIRIESGQALFMPAGAPGEDEIRFDLGAALPPLKAGEHRVYAMAGGARSNVWIFRIEGESGGGGKNEKEEETKKKPEPKPQEGGALPEQRPRFVEPLVREGEKVEKRARVPIEVPGGGAPRESSLEEAWPELERRKEAALNRAGLSPAARELVRTYFDSLKPPQEDDAAKESDK